MTTLFNSSQEIVFVLHGLTVTQTNKYIFFVFILILYLLTIFINVTMIFTIYLKTTLHGPMYLFICNLCNNGIIGASAFYPKILYDILFDSHVITYIGCLTQIFFSYFYVYSEFTTLTVMAYDRYVAICKPLHYHSIFNTRNALTMLLLTWLFSLIECCIGIVLTAGLPLCGVDIDKIYCSNWVVVKLSCVDNTVNNVNGYIFLFVQLFQAVLILISYVDIIKAALHSQADKRKFMQTCLPHLITLTNFTISYVFDRIYARYGNNSLLALRNIMSVEFLVVPPLLNPIIYGMTLTQIRNTLRQMFNIQFAAFK